MSFYCGGLCSFGAVVAVPESRAEQHDLQEDKIQERKERCSVTERSHILIRTANAVRRSLGQAP